jgi:hypothetical protein
MKARTVIIALAATLSVTAAWVFVYYLFSGTVDWLLALCFSLPFGLVFGLLWWRRSRRASA